MCNVYVYARICAVRSVTGFGCTGAELAPETPIITAASSSSSNQTRDNNINDNDDSDNFLSGRSLIEADTRKSRNGKNQRTILANFMRARADFVLW